MFLRGHVLAVAACLPCMAFLFLSGCSPSPKELAGDVFIVTKGGENYKLGLVPVDLIDEKVAAPYVEAQKKTARQQLPKLIAATNDGFGCLNFSNRHTEEQCDQMFKLGSWAFYTDGLPRLQSTKTDADGRFNFTVPRKGKYALVARASRSVGGDTENYYWFVWVSVDGEAPKRVMLSNDNLWKVDGPDVVVKPERDLRLSVVDPAHWKH
jgi:hypothetical protein